MNIFSRTDEFATCRPGDGFRDSADTLSETTEDDPVSMLDVLAAYEPSSGRHVRRY